MSREPQKSVSLKAGYADDFAVLYALCCFDGAVAGDGGND